MDDNNNHVHACVFSHVQLFETPWTVDRQAPLSMGVFRQEYCSGLPFPPPGNLPDPGIEPMSLVSPALADEFLTGGCIMKHHIYMYISCIMKL